MASWRRAVLLGLLVWLVPFVVAFAVFPLKTEWRSLFESIMPLTLAVIVVACALLYFRRVESHFLRDGIVLGVLWLLISVAIDLPLMLNPPMNYSPAEYAADIGLTYLMIPVITIGIAAAAAHRGRR